jgi:hypothetical protein
MYEQLFEPIIDHDYLSKKSDCSSLQELKQWRVSCVIFLLKLWINIPRVQNIFCIKQEMNVQDTPEAFAGWTTKKKAAPTKWGRKEEEKKRHKMPQRIRPARGTGTAAVRVVTTLTDSDIVGPIDYKSSWFYAPRVDSLHSLI